MKAIDDVQFRAIRSFLGVGKYSALPSLEGDMGWIPTKIRHQLDTLKLWFRLCNMPVYRITRKIFLWDYSLSRTKNTWCRDVKSLLNALGMERYHEHLGNNILRSSSIKTILTTSKQTLLSTYETDWVKKVKSLPKLRTYRCLKTELKVEDYVKAPMSRMNRSSIARMRNGTFPINIELGRYRNLPIEARLCDSCDANKIENEEHYLIHCTRYLGERIELFNKIQTVLKINIENLPNTEQLAVILTNGQICKYVAVYINKALQLRNTAINI